MPYEYKRKKDCEQESGKKGNFVTKKKGKKQRCWGSEKKFNSAQKARHASNSSDKKKEDNLLLDLDENKSDVSETNLRQVIEFLLLEFTRKKRRNLSSGGGGYYDDDYDDYYDDSHYLEAGLTYDDLEGYSDNDDYDDDDYSYYYDDEDEGDDDDD